MGVEGKAKQTAWKRILRWETQRARIEAAVADPATANKRTDRAKGIATTLSIEDEENIAIWVAQLRADGVPISNLMLKCKALEIARDVGLSPNDFKASPTWIRGFSKRWALSMRAKTRSGQANYEDGERALAELTSRLGKVIEEHGIEDIYNADQTGINYEYLPTHTLDATGAKSVWIKCAGRAKDRVTAMLLADNKGIKYPLFLVLKQPKSKIKEVVQENLIHRNGFGIRTWDDIQKLHERHPSRLYANPTAWWNSIISVEFLKYHFGHRRGQDLKKVLLLWDDFSAHFTDEVVTCARDLNVILEKVPPTFTWHCQPADVAWIKPMKAILRGKWVNSLREQIANHGGGGGKSFRLECPDRFELVEWVNDAWDQIPKETILKGFAKCNIPCLTMDETNHDLPTDEGVLDANTLRHLTDNHEVDIEILNNTSDIFQNDIPIEGNQQCERRCFDCNSVNS
ncbi:hypothetical protein Ae201684_012541 [Aphanomyces euteiches]|uniref:HTH CENPB-type domain-containing protein n=1 Tax=Aphanomyces euteiches TaxID=100861 RepID=A0A6G0WR76_9STRA|nr:hypothetical protein Ae201684_012541 [Aphanomyces euteiches]